MVGISVDWIVAFIQLGKILVYLFDLAVVFEDENIVLLGDGLDRSLKFVGVFGVKIDDF